MGSKKDQQAYQDYQDYHAYQAYQAMQPRVPNPGPNNSISLEPASSSAPIAEADDALQTGVQAMGNAFYQGYTPQMRGAAAMAVGDPNAELDAQLKGQGFQINQKPMTYTGERDAAVKDLAANAQRNPLASTAGSLTGTVMSALGAGKLLAPAAALPGAATAVTTLAQRARQAAMAGGLMGLASNPGDQPDVVDPIQFPAHLRDAVWGGTIGAGGQLAGEGAGMLASGAKSALNRVANSAAYRSMGPYVRQVIQSGQENIGDIGQTLRDMGVVKGWPTNFNGLADRAKKALNIAGPQLDNIIADYTEQAPNLVNSRRDIALRAVKDIQGKSPTVVGTLDENAKISDLARQFTPEGAPPNTPDALNLAQGETEKRALEKAIKWDRLPTDTPPLEEQVNRSLLTQTGKADEDLARIMEEGGAGPEGQFEAAKNTVGNLRQGQAAANKRAAHTFANNMISPSNWMAGGIGGLAGLADADHNDPFDMAKKIGGGMALGYLGKNYGNQVLAGLAGLGSDLSGLGMPAVKLGSLIKNNPQAAGIIDAATARNIWNQMNEQEQKP